jgi:hypothetical protein
MPKGTMWQLAISTALIRVNISKEPKNSTAILLSTSQEDMHAGCQPQNLCLKVLQISEMQNILTIILLCVFRDHTRERVKIMSLKCSQLQKISTLPTSQVSIWVIQLRSRMSTIVQLNVMQQRGASHLDILLTHQEKKCANCSPLISKISQRKTKRISFMSQAV